MADNTPQVPSVFRPLVKYVQSWVIEQLQRRGIGSRYIDAAYIRPAISSGMSNPMTTAGDIIVGGVDGAAGRLAKGTDGQVLKMAAGAVGWGTDNDSAGSPDASTVTYTPTTATDWDGDADPGDLDNALDQLAERVKALEGAGGGGASILEVQVFS